MPTSFRHVKRILTEPKSVFYSLLKLPNNNFIGFGRKNCPARIIKKVVLNDKLDIIEDNNDTFRGEDPRSFYLNEKMYVIDNYLNDMYLIAHNTNTAEKFTRINISGKNLSFIPHNGTLYFMHYIKPFVLYTCNVETGACQKVAVENHNQTTKDYEYRGGTPGYLVKGTDNQYFGFGHRTYMITGVMTHDVFKWVVTFPTDGRPPTIEYFEVEQPPQSKNICDPTCVIVINNSDTNDNIEKSYLITAETDEPWNDKIHQDYITNVYEIVDNSVITSNVQPSFNNPQRMTLVTRSRPKMMIQYN
jgi:hypothetical protein